MVSRVSVTGNGTDDGSAPEAYYRPGPDGVFTPTKATESPWSTDAQHGGPPSALFGHVIRSRHPDPGFRIARLTVEFLGTVPRSDVEVSTQMVRDGRRIRLIEASMSVAGKRVALARAWQIAVNKDVLADADRKPPQPADLPPVPDEQQQFYFGGRENWGYGEATEWRRVHGSFRSTGYAQVWTRLRIPLIVGQRKIDPLDRILVVADSANGVSSALDPRDWLFVPTAVTITLHRYPVGDWVLLAARTDLAEDGIGSTSGILSDQSGPLGTVTQPLLVAPTPGR